MTTVMTVMADSMVMSLVMPDPYPNPVCRSPVLMKTVIMMMVMSPMNLLPSKQKSSGEVREQHAKGCVSSQT